MRLFWQISSFLTGLYGATCVGMAAAVMHVWKNSLSEAALASLLSALAMLAFHTLALLVLNTQQSASRLVRLSAILWHVGLFCFVWTVIAGIFLLPLHYSGLAPVGGQILIASWLIFAVSGLFRS
ncbi:DUF423 domain-containing protein [Chromatiaceae bacterium AAb-1]|nr:DUF423 domain-containing protein [Chromatiaceae bacterium AAb-1]